MTIQHGVPFDSTILSVQNTNITELISSIGEYKYFEKLYIMNNSLTKLPLRLYEFTTLVELNVQHNNIERLA